MKFKYNIITFVIWIINIIIAIDSLSSYAETPPVQIWLKASWNAPQLVLEILESVAAENSKAYFPLVEEFLRQGLFSSKLTNYEIYKSALDIIEKKKFLSTPTTKSLFEFGLSLHTTAPTIQSYYHYYNSTIIPTRKFSNDEFNPECNVWADWYGNQACNVETLTKFIDTKLDISKATPKLLSFDHIRKSKIYSTQRQSRIIIFIRIWSRIGFKNTEYNLFDDRKVEEETDNVDKESINNSESSDDYLFDQNISEIKPAGEIESLGVKTAQVILESQDPLKTLTQLSQDFPKYSHYISQVPISYSLGQEIEMNQQNLRLEPNSFWLNGLVMDPLSVDPFSLLKLLCRERRTVSSLLNLGLNSNQAIGILSSPIIAKAQSPQDSSRGIFDVRDISPNNNVVVCLNDLEKDSKYSSWPNRIYGLLRPAYPGQLRMIRKNIFSILFILDLSSPENLEIIAEHINAFILRDTPLRFGLVPLFSKDQHDSIAISRIFYYIVDQFGPSTVKKFFKTIYSEIRKPLTIEFLQIVEQEFNKLIYKEVPRIEKLVNSFKEIINGNNTLVEEQIYESSNFIKRLKINTHDKGVLFVNGKFFDLDESHQRNVIQTVNEHLQLKAYVGEIDDTNIYEYLLTLPNIPNRRNPYIFTSELQPLQVINLADDNNNDYDDDNGFSLINNLKYIYSEIDEKVPVTIILISDTIVMTNFGYFQLKANPGVWTLNLREGKSTDIFDIQSVGSEGWLSRNISEIDNEIILNGFEGLTIYPRMIRKSGKENDDVLKTENSNDSEHMFTPKMDEKKGAEINIFSVISGHLYERFLYVMILSVLQHTNSTVKFWFIENFLSPSFKDFIPYMTKEYNFEYELVAYKWPHWLRAQTEKQRNIWGYKILFLDVLFPLDLDKVIFVDADQIVRTDLKELVDMDLQGAPYGYTPFCDNRPEMDDFRFWNHGHLKDHLRGKPYHFGLLFFIINIQFITINNTSYCCHYCHFL
ncbi:hypothetical protein Glove_138g61 [Diversispora epigaea]|uniref:Glucosyltransferase 24 catalytic domain-containing protein n=1 Tax=Diversispora epigaea TaxID=1348612 RepID=A0A397J2K7_9GLOM|nr:hypothetical protein Glove_138g61 [Diversispora epigaea]